jgi:glycosyltransferase involved in cell wall biosynthesis
MNTKISLVMIVKNEERNILRVLDNVKDFVDEMIIVDTGSSDKTKEIAVSLGAKVVDFTWVDDFAAARNFAQSQAKNDWVLIMDGDWELRTITQIPALDIECSAYNVRWINSWQGEEILSEQPRVILYNKHCYKWVGVVHEYLEFTGTQEQVGFLNWEVWHHQIDSLEKNKLYQKLVKNSFEQAATDLEKNQALMFWVQQLSKDGLWIDIVSTVNDNLVKECINHDAISIIEYWVVAMQKTQKTNEYLTEIISLLQKSNDDRVNLILGDVYLTIDPNVSVKYYNQYLELSVAQSILQLNWERYAVYPYLMLGNILQINNPLEAKEVFIKAAELTKIEQKRNQIMQLLNSK